MRRVGVPNGLKAIGFGAGDVDALVDGAMLQKRLIGLSPRQATAADFKQLFMDSLTCW